jgi:hypothetical protein
VKTSGGTILKSPPGAFHHGFAESERINTEKSGPRFALGKFSPAVELDGIGAHPTGHMPIEEHNQGSIFSNGGCALR